MYIRTLSRTIHAISDSFPVLMVTGPRQVGKTTLLEICAKEGAPAQRGYVTLDDMDARTLAQHDPAVFRQIWLGSFPRLNEQGPKARDLFYRSYIQTYLQRDVQDVLKVSDQMAFNRFLSAVAARTGQLLNYANLARDVDVDNKTAKAWLSVLETSGLVLLLRPYHTNLTKRLVKAPKLYFLDTGLAAYLTKWPDAASLEAGSMSGAMH